MGTLTASLVLPSELKKNPFLLHKKKQSTLFFYRGRSPKRHRSLFPVARLFGPAIFEASKLKVLFLGIDEKKHPGNLPRTYTLTHSDITAKLTLAISQSINNSQVLKAFVHGDGNLFNNYPELEEALAWVYFHSNIPEFNKVECWGPLKQAEAPFCRPNMAHEWKESPSSNWEIPQACQEDCSCCFPPMSLIPWSQEIGDVAAPQPTQGLQQQS